MRLILLLALFLTGCEMPWDISQPSAANKVAYRTGRDTAVIHYYTDQPGIYHDSTCGISGKPCRTWREIRHGDGRREFVRVKP